MNAEFKVYMTLAPDARHGGMLKALGEHAARHCGCTESDSVTFGDEVASAFRACIGSSDALVNVTFERTVRAIDAAISSDTLVRVSRPIHGEEKRS